MHQQHGLAGADASVVQVVVQAAVAQDVHDVDAWITAQLVKLFAQQDVVTL